MLDFEFDRMLFNIPVNEHKPEKITEILTNHPEVKFVSLVGIDIGGHDTDEKIPVELFLGSLEKILAHGVQTDGSSVVLPKIADLNNAKVDIIPDLSVNWYVDYNYNHKDKKTELPVGTLRIPAFLLHNDTNEVGSRVILRDAVRNFKTDLIEVLKNNPYVFEYLPIESVDEIEDLSLTCATELEFWVKTPDDEADREQLSTAQSLKEQYWKRTIGPVRTALEKSLMVLQQYGFEPEMGHKEVGGVKAKMGHSGDYDHIMEQLEIDWKYAEALQAADNENMIKYIVKDVFRAHGLDVTFMAKPMTGIAGSGEHTHLGVAAKLKDGRKINLFSGKDNEFMGPIGFGALLGILKNYEVINPFVSASNDSLNRLKPGYEAPVCTVTSLGHTVEKPSRNRTVLIGLVRELGNPLATRFELRAPNPKSNTYLVIAASYMAMLDGIKASLAAKKSSDDLLASLSKKWGDEDFYLEKDREYRSEREVFEEFTEEERNKLFGRAPATVWENINAFDIYPEKLEVFKADGVMNDLTLESYKEAIISQWATELHDRIIPNSMETVRRCVKLHDDDDCTNLDISRWLQIDIKRKAIGKDSIGNKCLLTRIKEALDIGDYETASDLQIEMQKAVEDLAELYITYRKNLF
ncbi:MAG: glutamine synthetase [Eubacteriales Family XIII. Incertae Sedis bacterium]|nr:MAG: glutamine synthetase [Clostridiales Family XIII bacterium]